MDSDILTPQKLASKFPLQPRPMKLTVSQCKIRANTRAKRLRMRKVSIFKLAVANANFTTRTPFLS